MPIQWTNFPVAPGYVPAWGINLYVFLVQLWRAARERAWGVGTEFWPRTSYKYDTEAASSYCKNSPGYSGIIDGVGTSGTSYTVTDSSKSFAALRYYGSPPDPDFPNYYDLIVELNELDPWRVARFQIVG